MLPGCTTGLIGCTSGFVRLHIGIAGSLPGCVTGRNEYLVNQSDVRLRNRLSGCITGVRLHNRHGWPSVRNTYTGEVLMNYKSLECYQRFIAGWVREILVSVQGETRVLTSKVCRYDNNFNLSSTSYPAYVIIIKVNHSQRMREKPLLPWVICEASGKVLAGHCNCMAAREMVLLSIRESCNYTSGT